MNLIIEIQHPNGDIVSRTRWTWAGFTHQVIRADGVWEDGTWNDHHTEEGEPTCLRDHVKKMIHSWCRYWEDKEHRVFASLDGRKVI